MGRKRDCVDHHTRYAVPERARQIVIDILDNEAGESRRDTANRIKDFALTREHKRRLAQVIGQCGLSRPIAGAW